MRCVRLAVMATLMAAATSAPDAQGRRGAAPMVLSVPVTTDLVLAKPDAYAGQLVTLSSAIDEVLSKTAFTVDQRKVVDGIVVKVGKPLLVIAPTLEAALTANKYITIVGSVMKFDAAALATRVKDYHIDLPPDVAARYQGQTVLLAMTIHSSTSAELTRKAAPAEPATKKPTP